MATYPVTVFRWDDPGAPQLVNGTISSFFNVLQKCLVEGYGDKTPLGWTRSYYDPANFKSAWRNNVANGGSGGSAYFYSSTNTDANNTNTRLTSVKAITTEGVITGQSKLMSMAIPTIVTSWILIGNSRGFHFYTFGASGGSSLINDNSATIRPAFYAGDFFSTTPNDAGRFVVVANLVDSGDSTQISNTRYINYASIVSNTSSAVIPLWDADGANNWYGYSFYCGVTNSQLDITPGISPISKAYEPFIIMIMNGSNRSNVQDRFGVPVRDSVVSPSLRGFIPGLFGLFNSFGFGEQLPLVYTDSGDDYHLLPYPGNNTSRMVIKTGAWDDPFA